MVVPSFAPLPSSHALRPQHTKTRYTHHSSCHLLHTLLHGPWVADLWSPPSFPTVSSLLDSRTRALLLQTGDFVDNGPRVFDPWPSLSRFVPQHAPQEMPRVLSAAGPRRPVTTLQTRRAIKSKDLSAQGPQASWRAYSALFLHLDLVRPPSIHPGKCGSFAEEPSWSSWGTTPHSRLGLFSLN